ncbi:MAG: hypothetical protein COB76_02660 [Alphaproteobacteria bacterium]|nr:MAG: hypothetical protein COB76_02660 [Alphaproteobacteria bacterium]
MALAQQNFKESTRKIFVKGGFDNLLRRLGVDTLENADLSGHEIHNINFPAGTSLKGANLTNAKLVQCDLPCDFTDARTTGLVLDFSTINQSTGLDISRCESSENINPFEALSKADSVNIPLRRGRPKTYALRKLT